MRRVISCGAFMLMAGTGADTAADGDIFWSIRSSNTAPTPSNPYVDFAISVGVTGANQGLAYFVMELGVYERDGDAVGQLAPHPVFWPGGAIDWAAVYRAQGSAGDGRIIDVAVSGGPGLNCLPSLGWPSSQFAYVDQLAAGYDFLWKPRRRGPTWIKKWIGDDTWGVGLDSRKAAVLQDSDGTYDVFTGVIDVTGWAPGTYSVMVIPPGTVPIAGVLREGLDFNVEMDHSVTEKLPAARIHGASFDFHVPEPAALLLFAGAGLLVPRRRRVARTRRHPLRDPADR